MLRLVQVQHLKTSAHSCEGNLTTSIDGEDKGLEFYNLFDYIL